MSYEKHSALPHSPLPDRYELPDNQLTFELELRDNYAKRFPEENEVMTEILADVQRFGGIGVPKYQIIAEQQEEAHAAGIADGEGYIESSSPGFTAVVLRTPKGINVPAQPNHGIFSSPQETEDAHYRAQQQHRNDKDTRLIFGEIPESTLAMLDGIYQLTGASTVLAGNASSTSVVIRKGEYHNAPIYIQEVQSDARSFGEDSMFSVKFLSEDFAKRAAKLLDLDIVEPKRLPKLRGLLKLLDRR